MGPLLPHQAIGRGQAVQANTVTPPTPLGSKSQIQPSPKEQDQSSVTADKPSIDRTTKPKEVVPATPTINRQVKPMSPEMYRQKILSLQPVQGTVVR